jgi:hypothetical protein
MANNQIKVIDEIEKELKEQILDSLRDIKSNNPSYTSLQNIRNKFKSTPNGRFLDETVKILP